jgi:hypothetical protein
VFAVVLDVIPAGFGMMMLGMARVTMRGVRVVGGLFVIACFVVLGGLAVMLCRVLMVFGGLVVMVDACVAHCFSPG